MNADDAMRRPALLIALLLAACVRAETPPLSGNDTQPTVRTSNTTALRINGKLISLKKVEQIFEEALPLVLDRARNEKFEEAELNKALQEAWSDALQTVIQDELLDQRGRELRSRIIKNYVNRARPGTPPSRVLDSFKRLEDDEIRKMKKWKVEAAGGAKEFYAALRRRGISLAQWEDNLRTELFRRIVLEQAVGPITLSPERVKQYYEDHPDRFGTPDAWRLRRIRLPKNRFKSGDDALAAAKVIRKQIEKGLAFEKVAATLDYDPPYNAAGGLLSVGGRTGLPSGNFPAEESIAKDLANGAASQPVDIGEAILIVKREDYRPAKKLPFNEKTASNAWNTLFAEEVKKRKEAFFEKQKKDAFIEILQKTPPEKYMK